MTDIVEISTANPAFSTMMNSIKAWPSDYDNDVQPEIAKLVPKTSILPFPVIGRCLNHNDTSVEFVAIENADMPLECRRYLS